MQHYWYLMSWPVNFVQVNRILTKFCHWRHSCKYDTPWRMLCSAVFCVLFRWRSQSGSSASWRKHTSWVCCVTVRLHSSSSMARTNCFSMQVQTWTVCCWDTQNIMSRMRAAPTATSSMYVKWLYSAETTLLLISGHFSNAVVDYVYNFLGCFPKMRHLSK